jgi:hypothetical protein
MRARQSQLRCRCRLDIASLFRRHDNHVPDNADSHSVVMQVAPQHRSGEPCHDAVASAGRKAALNQCPLRAIVLPVKFSVATECPFDSVRT